MASTLLQYIAENRLHEVCNVDYLLAFAFCTLSHHLQVCIVCEMLLFCRLFKHTTVFFFYILWLATHPQHRIVFI